MNHLLSISRPTPRLLRRAAALTLVTATATLGCAGASAQQPPLGTTQRIFLKLDTLVGPVKQPPAHAGEIPIIGFSAQVTNPAGAGSAASGGGAGKAAGCGQFVLTKELDQTSPNIFFDAVTGAHLAKAAITFENVNRGGAPFDYFVVQLTDLVITAVAQSDPKDGVVMESMTLQATRFSYSYTPNRPDGTAGAPIAFSFDCAQNTTQ